MKPCAISVLLALCATLITPLCVANECKFVEHKIPLKYVEEGSSTEIKTTKRTIEIQGAAFRSAQIWEGPIVVHQEGSECASQVGVIETPLASYGDFFYVSTFSGETTTLYVVDLRTCKTAWKSKEFLEPDIQFKNHSVRVNGKWVRIGTDCLPVAKSDVITKEGL